MKYLHILERTQNQQYRTILVVFGKYTRLFVKFFIKKSFKTNGNFVYDNLCVENFFSLFNHLINYTLSNIFDNCL